MPFNEAPYIAFQATIGHEGQGLVNEARWKAIPTWVAVDVLVFTKTNKPTEALAAIARYELYALTVNAYSILDSATTLPHISSSQPLLYHSAAHLLPPQLFDLNQLHFLPLLPLSQEYSLQSFLAALKAFDFLCFWSERHKAAHDHRRTGIWKSLLSTARQTYGHSWESQTVSSRRMMSRAVWNAAVSVLAGHPAPSMENLLIGQVHIAPIGGAHPFQLPHAASVVESVIHNASTSQDAFVRTVQLASTQVRERFATAEGQTWSSIVETGCTARLEQKGRMRALHPDDRRRILTELLIFCDRFMGWRSVAPSADSLFECLDIVPTVPCPYPLPLPTGSHHPAQLSALTAHSLSHRRMPAPAASIGHRAAARLGTTPENWAAGAARMAY
ncbi:hypothetical protein JCM11251_004653 [Rhodosporidiobolus azoricus]